MPTPWEQDGPERRGPRRWLFPLLALCVSTAATLAALELGLRLVGGGGLLGSPQAARVGTRMVGGSYPGTYDPRLGFVPRPGFSGRATHARVTIDGDGLRANGGPPPPGTPILAVGDSFTFGDEADDDGTWPAALERRLGRPVRNGGVFGYGLDQIVLRAEALLGRIAADTLVVAFIPDDVRRCEFAYRYGWKPYFEPVEGSLVLRNVPVPEPHRGPPEEALVLRLLRGSFLADLLLRRLAADWWLLPDSIRAHRQGTEVSVALVDRLADGARDRGHRLLLVAQWFPGTHRSLLEPLIERAASRGVEVLDLYPVLRAALDAPGGSMERYFRVHLWQGRRIPGHMSPRGNELVAEAIADRLLRE